MGTVLVLLLLSLSLPVVSPGDDGFGEVLVLV